MKVLNLQCANHHAFEGWFASDADFQSQQERGLVACPLCADSMVSKMPSAPRLNLGASRGDEPVPAGARPEAAMQAAWMRIARHVLANTDDVGEKFAEEARRIHYGEAEARNIRGQASPEQTAELIEEGIEVMPLPIPAALTGPLQ